MYAHKETVVSATLQLLIMIPLHPQRECIACDVHMYVVYLPLDLPPTVHDLPQKVKKCSMFLWPVAGAGK
jgi:hypothetical protein